MEPIAWLLNFDAELELARPRQYQPSHRVLHLCERFAPRAGDLLTPHAIVLSRPTQPGCAAEHRGVAWCPTPHARRELQRAGAQLGPAPSLQCLQKVNSRRFLVSLGLTLPGALYTRKRQDVVQYLAHFSAHGCVLKRDHGFAGRGIRRIRGVPQRDDWHWIDTALGLGGLLLEPWVRVDAEYSQHAYLPQQGALRVGVPCQQHTDTRGRWLRTEPLKPGSLQPPLAHALATAVHRCGEALRQAGYFGPFGLDAYTYEDLGGSLGFNAHSDLNARYTMGYSAGMGSTSASSPVATTTAPSPDGR